MRRLATGLVIVLLAAACAGGLGRSTRDARVKSYLGQLPPELSSDGVWIGVDGLTTLAALRGRVVYLQFAFPT